MQKRSYFDTALESIKILKENLILYLPDIIFAVSTLILAILFLYTNKLTILFSGLELFKDRIKDIVFSKSSLVKLLISLTIFVLINLFIGLGTIAIRYNLIKMAAKKEKVSFRKAYSEAHKYFTSIIGLKLAFLGIYLVPIIVLLGIGLIYKKLLVLMIMLLLLVFLVIRFVFLFTYPILFLKTEKVTILILKESIDYFNNNKKHVIITGIYTAVVGIVITAILNLISKSLAFDLVNLSFLAGIFLLIKTLVEINLLLWSNLFVFKNF